MAERTDHLSRRQRLLSLALMRWCDKHDVGYLIGLARNAVLKRLARPWTEVSAAQFAQTKEKQRLFGELVYGAETWDRQRRVIVKAEYLDEGPNTRFLVTNLAARATAVRRGLLPARGRGEPDQRTAVGLVCRPDQLP